MKDNQHTLYTEAGERFAPAIARMAQAMERDREKARDLEQDIHCEIWRSLERFDGRCSLKTWVYRVAHNVAAEHVARAMRRPGKVPLDDIDPVAAPIDLEGDAGESHAMGRARALIRLLPTLDAQVLLLWLEGESGKEIAEVTGLGSSAVATRIHRLKAAIAGAFSPPDAKDDDDDQ